MGCALRIVGLCSVPASNARIGCSPILYLGQQWAVYNVLNVQCSVMSPIPQIAHQLLAESCDGTHQSYCLFPADSPTHYIHRALLHCDQLNRTALYCNQQRCTTLHGAALHGAARDLAQSPWEWNRPVKTRDWGTGDGLDPVYISRNRSVHPYTTRRVPTCLEINIFSLIIMTPFYLSQLQQQTNSFFSLYITTWHISPIHPL